MSGWRVGDAGHTIFGPNNGAPSPETIATVRKRENAPVLAAAPELLRELEGFVNRWSKYPKKPIGAELEIYLESARKAIAKAKGVQS